MAQELRQNNLFAAEDYRNVYKSFKNVDFRSYDFDSLKESMIEYIKRNFPEDFNDYIESSEYIALIELLAYLGTSLSFRVDMNTRENFIDTAERRESIIRLAQMINYQPSRNLPANGMFKLTAVETTEPVKDSLNRTLSNLTVFWDDPNNENSYDQFTAILNAAFTSSTPFGRPAKRGKVGGINTDLYQLDVIRGTQVTYQITISVNGERLPFDICNVDFDEQGKVFERHPDPAEAFNIAYQNDGQGFSSPNTGFFVYFRQGTLKNYDFEYLFPENNRNETISDTNINQDDIYLQEITEDGDVLSKWEQVKYSRGNESVVYNSISKDTRKIFSVKTEANDAVTLQFSDGSFGEVPTGILRLWARRSANKNLVIRPEEARNISINVGYSGANGQPYILRLVFSLEQTITNSAPAETNDEIKVRAPQVYYTQDRMVNNKDYNTFPLTRGNEIVKLRTINRTHAGHSRYLPINDPTGFHQSIYLTAADGAFYKDHQSPSLTLDYNANLDSADSLVSGGIEGFLRNIELMNFLYDDYLDEYRRLKRETWTTDSTYNRDNVYLVTSQITWSTKNAAISDDIGFLNNGASNIFISSSFAGRTFGLDKFIEEGAVLTFAESASSKNKVSSRIGDIIYGTTDPELDGKQISLNAIIPDGWVLISVYPNFRTTFTDSERTNVTREIGASSNFALEYIIEPTGTKKTGWNVLRQDVSATSEFGLGMNSETETWLVNATYNSSSNQDDSSYTFTSRGSRYIFESESDVKFFIDPTQQKNFSVDELVADLDEIILNGANVAAPIEETWRLEVNRWVSAADVNLTYPAQYVVLGTRNANPTNTRIIVTINDIAKTRYDISENISNGILSLVSPKFKNVTTGESITGSSIVISSGSTISIYMGDGANTLGRDYKLNAIRPYYEPSGFLNQSKIEVTPVDSNGDGIPDEPYAFNDIVGRDSIVFNETVVDANGDSYRKIWSTNWLDLRGKAITSIQYSTLLGTGLYLINDDQYAKLIFALTTSVVTQAYNSNNKIPDEATLKQYSASVYREKRDPSTQKLLLDGSMVKITVNSDGLNSAYRKLSTGKSIETTVIQSVGNNKIFNAGFDNHYVEHGRSFTLDNRSVSPTSFDYKWRHLSPADNRIDPSVSNIMDMIILTKTYYDEVLKWKKEGKTLAEFPEAPTTEELRTTFSDFSKYKMMSDEIIYNSSSFKVIFGSQAPIELRAKFKVIKVPTSIMTDNEIKTKTVELINEFFDISNWDFGETFYFTELAAYIHKGLAGIVGTVILVPESGESQFGNLFEVRVGANEILLPTAKATDIIIVDTLTELNMRLN